jgi:hypothetical protein
MCSSYMARLDAANQVWLNCEGPRLSRLHAAVTGASGAWLQGAARGCCNPRVCTHACMLVWCRAMTCAAATTVSLITGLLYLTGGRTQVNQVVAAVEVRAACACCLTSVARLPL